ncbi:PEGA domain-containing protein [Pelagicoccus sp. SDUM812003]|uniref:PEGA domain-containing protein n=1 Tax=Pelagicoccus sp. SDUM812003 TaxID=3041267 RepID=UPI00280EBEC6|nr:PEGA domain-containing protein [Pelagicoccus sp. SDUM812003]MDQ8202662.1 PEGA domain-containing protein [Pelagicoccus sp. SDUM812003]
MKFPVVPIVVSLLSIAVFSGCATVTRGTKDVLVIESDPSGALVTLSNGLTGTTPTSFKVSRKKPISVTIEKKGYETVFVQVNPAIEGAGAAGMAGNVLVGGIIGVGVDAMSGATKNLRPNPVTVKLVPVAVGDNNAEGEDLTFQLYLESVDGELFLSIKPELS